MRLLALILVWITSTVTLAASAFEATNPSGPYAVGLQRVQQIDHTRVYRPTMDMDTGKAITGERARPVQMLVWYPATKSASKHLSFGDYVRLGLTDDDFSLSQAQIDKLYANQARRLARDMGDAKRADGALSAAMLASRDAPAAAGKFPVVVYAPGAGGGATENSDLCEWLASHGFIVIASPSKGAYTRTITIDMEGLEAQVGDIGLAMAYAHHMPQADTSKIAGMGFSFGGLAQVLAAAKDDRIRALVSLDGSLRAHAEFINGSKDAARYVSPARVAIPLLYLAAQPAPLEKLIGSYDLNYSFVNAMRYSDVYGVTMWPMQHTDFSSESLRSSNPARYNDYSLEEVSVAHNAMHQYVLHFLKARLLGDAASEAFLTRDPRQNGLPPHVATMSVTRAKGAAPTFQSMVPELYQSGFARAVAAYEARNKLDPQFKPQEHILNNWAYKLLQHGRTKDAIEIFRLNTVVYPSSWNAFDSLAEGYATDGNKPLAIEYYKKSLELNPENGNAVEQLKQLGAGA